MTTTSLHTPIPEIAESFVGPLLSEDILSVRKDHVQIMGLTIPRHRLVYFHLALSQLRMGYPVSQSANGFSVEPITIVRGNDTEPGYRIVDNIDNDSSILLTRKLAAELYEVLLFFVEVPTVDISDERE